MFGGSATKILLIVIIRLASLFFIIYFSNKFKLTILQFYPVKYNLNTKTKTKIFFHFHFES